jgi:hypothetical protein
LGEIYQAAFASAPRQPQARNQGTDADDARNRIRISPIAHYLASMRRPLRGSHS